MTTNINLRDLTVDEYTSPCPYVATKDTSLDEILKSMDEKGIRHLPVVEDNKAIGIISDRDLRLIINVAQAKNLKASDIMTDDPYSVVVGTTLEEIAYNLSERKIGSALVTNLDGSINGIFTSTDALNALIEVLRDDVQV